MATKAKAKIVVAWVTDAERCSFYEAWQLDKTPSFLHLQRDADREGCGATKNRGIIAASASGAEIVLVLDGDCYPSEEAPTLEALLEQHVVALEPQQVELYQAVTYPPSRGVPYGELNALMPVAASMGFWLNVPDYCAVRQLAFAAEGDPMQFIREPIFQRYFPLCGMNLAFKPELWWPWCQFIEVSRFDDIWMGWLWQREAYRQGYCFNLDGPFITHSRQSNVWKNLIDEARYLEQTESLWRQIAQAADGSYASLLKLLPAGTERLSVEPMPSVQPDAQV